MAQSSGPSPLQAAYIALADTKPGSPEFHAAMEHITALKAEQGESGENRERTEACGFGTCSRRFFRSSDEALERAGLAGAEIPSVGAYTHKSGPRQIDNPDYGKVADAPRKIDNPDFCEGAARYAAGKALSKRTTW